MPGVPRIMYMEWPFQIFQTRDHIAMTFEWSQVFRLIYTNGSKPSEDLEFWMGDSRGRWEGDTLVVEVTNHDDRSGGCRTAGPTSTGFIRPMPGEPIGASRRIRPWI